jgi:hypothetical protein
MLPYLITCLLLCTLVGCGQDKGLTYEAKGTQMLKTAHQSPLW